MDHPHPRTAAKDALLHYLEKHDCKICINVKECRCIIYRGKTTTRRKFKGHKVHFTEDADKFSDTSAITVQQLDVNKYAVHLGFLKLQHRYEVRFGVSRSLSDVIQNPPHLFARLVEVIPNSYSPTDTELKVEFFAHKEKLLKEVIVVEDVNTNEAITFVLNARVLGKGKGTPSLKTGIRCIGCELEDESEASDWQGFV